jgi:8-oxo-dGTP diphosphatase
MRRRYPVAPVVSVGVLVVRGGKILLAQRGHEPAEGLWTFPGGVVELGETLVQAAAREVREECGIDVVVRKPLTVVDRIFRDAEGQVEYHYVIVEMLADNLQGKVSPGSDACAVGWFTPEEMQSLPMTEGSTGIALAALAEAASRFDGDASSRHNTSHKGE